MATDNDNCRISIQSQQANVICTEILQLSLSRSEEHTSELQSHLNLVCRLLLEKKKRIMYMKQRESSSCLSVPDLLDGIRYQLLRHSFSRAQPCTRAHIERGQWHRAGIHRRSLR